MSPFIAFLLGASLASLVYARRAYVEALRDHDRPAVVSRDAWDQLVLSWTAARERNITYRRREKRRSRRCRARWQREHSATDAAVGGGE